MSREKILAAVKANQPEQVGLPTDLLFPEVVQQDAIAKFVETLTMIGGTVIQIDSLEGVENYIKENYTANNRVVSPINELSCYREFSIDEDPHNLENVAFAVCKTNFAVAENGATWVTEDLMGARVLPFITQHLGLVVEAEKIVPFMHQAYQMIEDNHQYGFGAFIAGPSKTADIEQSLVLGAHGARSLVVFLLGK